MNSIDQTRKELSEKEGEFNYGMYKGFNLGCQMQKEQDTKEFLDFLNDLDCGAYINESEFIANKIKELKASLGETPQ